MKVTFILPAIGKKRGQKYIKSWQAMEPLTISTLKALTPDTIETEFFDDRIELIDYDTKTDLVAISVETYTAYRAYSIADRFRKKGIPVVMGGYHVMSLPEEAKLHADAIIAGNAESVWATVLHDAACRRLRKRYVGKFGYSDRIPDRSIYATKKYSPIGLVETGRGCSFSCGFCSITKCYHSKYYPRNIKDVIEDIRSSKKKFYFFVDDNIVANPKYALELCKAITPLKIRWSGQGTLTMAKDPELLSWIKKSGCDLLLIGFESLDTRNLTMMNKEWSAKIGERDALVQRIHDAGISIYATMLFGYDYDTPDTFRKALDFCLQHGFYFAAFNHVTPFPGTPLYERLQNEERLIYKKWWLDTAYRYGNLPFHPNNMTHDEVMRHCAQARREFSSTLNILKRCIKLLHRNKNPFFSILFLYANFLVQREVDERLELPLGTGLDELPK